MRGGRTRKKERSEERPISKNHRPMVAPERAIPSENGMTRLRFSALPLSLILLSCVSAYPQFALPGTAPGQRNPMLPKTLSTVLRPALE